MQLGQKGYTTALGGRTTSLEGRTTSLGGRTTSLGGRTTSLAQEGPTTVSRFARWLLRLKAAGTLAVGDALRTGTPFVADIHLVAAGMYLNASAAPGVPFGLCSLPPDSLCLMRIWGLVACL